MRSNYKNATHQLSLIIEHYDRRYLAGDPVYFVHQYKNPRDQEVVGLISALLAFGNVKSIHASIKKVLDLLGPNPAETIKNFDLKESALSHLGHRWVRSADLYLLFTTLQKILNDHRTLEDFFLEGYRPEDADISGVLHQFSQRTKSLAGGKKHSRGFSYFFPSPEDGSPCKRLVLFLRWMVRPADGIDLGLWKKASPSQLIVPLDTHIYNFARKFGLSRYQSPNWKVALDVTRFLKTLDANDPIKFDFPICHYGMEVGWAKNKAKERNT